MKISILSLFPDMFKSVLGESIIGRAIENNIVELKYINIRDFSNDKHNRVDDYPFGGGPGMVMKPEPIYRAIEHVKSDYSRVIYLSPKGKVFNQSMANELSREKDLVFLCGHYEGIDNRIIENYVDDIISLGDYVLTGGEIPAMVMIDSIVRLLPGVLKSDESFIDESHYNGLLEYPQYTRPREFKGHEVPEILLSGNHKKIDEWRKYESIKLTYKNRPDLLENINLSLEEKRYLDKIEQEEKNKL
ncbi:tRNA (guanosine(37)-N1)-methyltransferase TrmD [Clostridium sp. D2Q-14]|uniref:tRNA (guanosine(37)-N1)-methyltransferase TrmD n=1 Tax=Anaeromonas gelatinilytica TaxID=2683194 RepID=UPI00193BE73C|nr:tRNA (guanosine(37)-N1)-methyltransferase TrmD [Anaeromonas gelatinilytica]MBS4536072.1 tRNA (guanosine(37)-N1)-methyltransferase TrmD [Anaeromonas gelatinilytica]